MSSLDLTDRPAVTNWIAGVYLHTLEVLLLASDLLSPTPWFSRAEAHDKLDRCRAAFDSLFSRVDGILRERGARGPLRRRTTEEIAKHEANVKAQWEAEQAKLPLHQRRTWEQACEDEHEAMRGRPERQPPQKGGRATRKPRGGAR